MTLGENLEVINLRAIAGEYDSQARHIDISKLPVLLENQQKGGYRVYLDPSDQGADVGLFCNQSFDKDPEIAKWLGTREFRIALSHGIDRQQINETFVLGLGQTGSAAPGERTPLLPGPGVQDAARAYDVKKANEMLDKLGLTKKDGEGYRLRADGGGRLRLALTTYLGFLPFTQIAEMVVRAVEEDRHPGRGPGDGARPRHRPAAGQRAPDLLRDPVGRRQHVRPHPVLLPDRRRHARRPALRQSGTRAAGTQGKEPPPRMRELMEKYRKAFGVPDAERTRLAKEVWKIALDEMWVIPVVSNSPASQGVRVIKNEHGQHPGAALEQRGQRQPAHRPHRDLVLQELAEISTVAAGWGAGGCR